MDIAKQSRPELASGLLARELAVRLIHDVIDRHHLLDASLARWSDDNLFANLDRRDRALARLLAATTLRRTGQIAAVLGQFIERPLPANQGRLTSILHAAVAHLLFLDGAPHAVINLAVEQCKRDPKAKRFAKLTNAVLRKVAGQGRARLAVQSDQLNVPSWLRERWRVTYGDERAATICTSSLQEAPLDISVKSDAAGWASRLGGSVLSTGTVRIFKSGLVEDLAAYNDGEWWVQDAAASLPARLLGDVNGKRVADLCAAPGGKAAQLAAAGAHVTAVDASERRLERLNQNMARLGFKVETIAADIATWTPSQVFDAVLLDAPCSATGTIRRHPDLLHVKSAQDISRLASLQQTMLDHVAGFVKPGGLFVYCTCSLEPEEGPEQIVRFLDAHPDFQRRVIDITALGGEPDWLDKYGALRTLPCHLQATGEHAGGMDGFYAVLLTRS